MRSSCRTGSTVPCPRASLARRDGGAVWRWLRLPTRGRSNFCLLWSVARVFTSVLCLRVWRPCHLSLKVFVTPQQCFTQKLARWNFTGFWQSVTLMARHGFIPPTPSGCCALMKYLRQQERAWEFGKTSKPLRPAMWGKSLPWCWSHLGRYYTRPAMPGPNLWRRQAASRRWQRFWLSNLTQRFL